MCPSARYTSTTNTQNVAYRNRSGRNDSGFPLDASVTVPFGLNASSQKLSCGNSPSTSRWSIPPNRATRSGHTAIIRNKILLYRRKTAVQTRRHRKKNTKLRVKITFRIAKDTPISTF